MNKILFDTKFLQLKCAISKLGTPWFYAHRPNATGGVVILPVTEDEILFTIEQRPPMEAEGFPKYSIAVPAGLVGDERIGESVEDAVKAELLEEVGLIADSIEFKSNRMASSPGCVSEVFTVVVAKIKDKTVVQPPINDGGVIIDRIWIKKSDVHSWLRTMESSGYILCAQTLAALFYLYE